MAKKTGWGALPEKYNKMNADGSFPFVTKSVQVRYGLWEGTVKDAMLSGGTDEQIREEFREYGCSEGEIDGYFEQYAEPLTMSAAAGR